MINHTDEGNNDSPTHETIVIINCVLNAPLMLTSIIGNSLVLAAVWKTPSIRSTSMIMLCSLAVSDLLVGLVVQPLYIADELTKDLLLYRVSGMIGFYVCGVSFGTMTAISVDRLIALHYHMRYASLMSECRVKFIVGMIWVVIFPFLGLHLWNIFTFHLVAGIFIAVCLVICTFTYIKIYGIVRHHQIQIHVQQQAVENSDIGNNILMARLKKSAINTFIFYIFMIICYFPQVILLSLFGTLYKNWKTEWSFAVTVVHMNSSFNPVLYCWRLRELRAAVFQIVKQLLFKQTEENCA